MTAIWIALAHLTPSWLLPLAGSCGALASVCGAWAGMRRLFGEGG